MKVREGPAGSVPRALPVAGAPVSPVGVPSDPLAFTRELRYLDNDTPIDEAGVALVDLAVIAYSDLDTIRRTFDRLGVDIAAFDPGVDRAQDLAWLRSLPSLHGRLLRSPFDAIAGRPSRPDDPRNRPPRAIAFRHGSDACIAFRGTSTGLDWKRDLTCWPARRRPLRHQGFETTWQEVRPQVERWLEAQTLQLGVRPVVRLGGHSLAGAVATIAAVDLAALGYPVARVVTIGSPRVGGRRFRALYRDTAATPSRAGDTRFLPAVTTRIVHGTDAVTVVPPPPFAVHVVPAVSLRAADRLDVRDFVGNGLFDTAPLMMLLAGATSTPSLGYTAGMAPSAPVSRIGLLRAVATQVALWIAMAFPALAWLRVLPFLPIAVAQGHVSVVQHFRARYWSFLPPTALRARYVEVLMEASAPGPTPDDGPGAPVHRDAASRS